jgi:D-sedoheptulose 7-phosphate isomerase
MSHIVTGFKQAHNVLDQCIGNVAFLRSIEMAQEQLIKTFETNNKVMSCGNGGSFCDAMHFAEELTGRFQKDRAPLAAICLSDMGHATCVSNDYGYNFIFSRLVTALGKNGDTLLAISTSGNSANIIEAVHEAKLLGIKTIGLLGKDGGKLKDLVEFPIIVPSNQTERIQEIHIKIIHLLIEGIERKIFPKNYI